MKALLYVRLSAADVGKTPAQELARLKHFAEKVRDWQVVGVFADPGPGVSGARPGVVALAQAIREGRGTIVVTNGIARLFRGLRHLVELGAKMQELGVELVATDEALDTTSLADKLRWEAALTLLAGAARAHRSEAAKVAHILRVARGNEAFGRPAALINPLELRVYYEGRDGKRPLSLSEMAAKLDVGGATVRKYVRIFLEDGTLNPETRAANLTAHGGLRKGGRPRKRPVDLPRLIALWQGERPEPTLTAIAKKLGTSRATAKKEVDRLRGGGQIDDGVREQRLAARRESKR